jgi:guanylate cyclase
VSVKESFWEGLSAKTRPTKPLETIENPMSIVLLVAGSAFGAFVFAVLFALILSAFDERAAAWGAITLALAYLTAWFWFAATGSVAAAIGIATAASIAAQLLLHISLGGYANSGAFLMWGITMTFIVALVFGRNAAIGLGIFYVVAAIVFGLLEQTLAANRVAPDPTLSTMLFVTVLVGNLVLVSTIFMYFLGRLSFERERAEGLLLNVLPEVVAAELKETGTTTARHYESVSVLFADIVGFTPLSAQMEPEEMVNQLNNVFTYFDSLADKYGVEKIRTIGDNYMVASGVPLPRDDHAQALCAMAVDMLEYSKTGPLSFRLGINSGPAVAGVIGTRKFQYDIWGDTVNTASRMESHGEPGRIQISEATYELIQDQFATTPRGPVEVKGKGTLTTWWLDSIVEPATT